MKKSNIILGAIFSIVLISCGSSIESDAEKVAKLICEASNDSSKYSENDEKASKISDKYTGKDKEEFEKLVNEKAKDCLYGDAVILQDENSSDSYEDSVSSRSSEDIDAMLDSYEDYINEYISYMNKMNNDDMSALSDLPALNEKGQEWASKMEKAKGNMTARQLSRMSEIINKMNIAMSDLK